MERLTGLYQNYYQAIQEATKGTSVFSALFGQPLSNAPRNAQFLKDAKALLAQGFEKLYPRRERLPIPNTVLKALQAQGKI